MTKTIQVEFFGTALHELQHPITKKPTEAVGSIFSSEIPSTVHVVLDNDDFTLADLFVQLCAQYPPTERLFRGGELDQAYHVSLDGRRFTRNPDFSLENVSSILFMSIDAGG